MKKSVNSLVNELSKSEMENLTNVTHETIAFELAPSNNIIFTAADLWNIQRNLKSRNQRRYF
jgi:hypothetical protein